MKSTSLQSNVERHHLQWWPGTHSLREENKRPSEQNLKVFHRSCSDISFLYHPIASYIKNLLLKCHLLLYKKKWTHMNHTSRWQLADEKEECRQRAERTKTTRELQAEMRISQLQQWVERRLAARDTNPPHPHNPKTCVFRRARDPLTGLFPLTR